MRNNTIFKIIIVLLLVFIAVHFIRTRLYQQNNLPRQQKEQPAGKSIVPSVNSRDLNKVAGKIDELTKEAVVLAYVKQNNHLPDYYITKKEARKRGWNPAEGNLCDVLPGKAIGGDIFTNREGQLPEKPGRTWYEADLNYHCAHRNADRLLFSNDGLLFVTKDHYKTFVQK